MVEDDVGLRNRMSGRLRAMGATVTEVGRLAETRKLLRELRFDFALVDLHLPDGDLHCITQYPSKIMKN